jgi:hypothetical protein
MNEVGKILFIAGLALAGLGLLLWLGLGTGWFGRLPEIFILNGKMFAFIFRWSASCF